MFNDTVGKGKRLQLINLIIKCAIMSPGRIICAWTFIQDMAVLNKLKFYYITKFIVNNMYMIARMRKNLWACDYDCTVF